MAKKSINTKLREEIKELQEAVSVNQRMKEAAWKEEKIQRERADLYGRLNETERRHSEEKIVFMEENVAWFRSLLEKMVVDPEVLRIELKRMQIESKEARKHENHTEQLEQQRSKRYERDHRAAMKNPGHIGVDMANTQMDKYGRPMRDDMLARPRPSSFSGGLRDKLLGR